jgi:hypothetical protein
MAASRSNSGIYKAKGNAKVQTVTARGLQSHMDISRKGCKLAP